MSGWLEWSDPTDPQPGNNREVKSGQRPSGNRKTQPICPRNFFSTTFHDLIQKDIRVLHVNTNEDFIGFGSFS